MSRRLLVAIAALALAAPLAHASEPVSLRLRQSIALMTPRLEVTEIFARLAQNAAVSETSDGVNSRSTATELVIARIGADGKPVIACVDSAEAAERFFLAPVGRIGQRKAQNQ